MADSRDVAAFFGKNHKDVLRAIRELGCSAEFRQRNFAPFKVNDLTGESTSHVMMTKDGFTFLAMGFTGERAAFFGKNHFDVLKAVRNLNCSRGFRDSNFAAFKIKDLTGEYTSHVLMTKDGAGRTTAKMAVVAHFKWCTFVPGGTISLSSI